MRGAGRASDCAVYCRDVLWFVDPPLLGDEEIASAGRKLPEVVASLLFDGLLHNKEIFDNEYFIFY